MQTLHEWLLMEVCIVHRGILCLHAAKHALLSHARLVAVPSANEWCTLHCFTHCKMGRLLVNIHCQTLSACCWPILV